MYYYKTIIYAGSLNQHIFNPAKIIEVNLCYDYYYHLQGPGHVLDLDQWKTCSLMYFKDILNL